VAFLTHHYFLEIPPSHSINTSFLLMSEEYFMVWTYSPLDGQLNDFCFWAVTHGAVVTLCLRVFVCTCSHFSGRNAKSAITESYGSCMFSFTRSCLIAFQSGFALHAPTAIMSGLASLLLPAFGGGIIFYFSHFGRCDF
jgi:hypothetical protein